jgi:chromosome segregation ATPase
VTISSTNDKEVQRQVEYLKAKSEVFQEEVKDLREENKEYRILLKSQEINKSTKNPISFTKMFDDYQTMKNEIKALRETNKQFSKNIDAWINNNNILEQPISANVNNDKLVQIKSEFVDELNNLKIENKKYDDKIDKLKENAISYQNNIELLKLENQNKKQLIFALKERTQENRESLNLLVQGEEVYESVIAELRDESFIQKQKILVYENKIKSFDKKFDVVDMEQTKSEQNIIKLEKQNLQYSDTVNELEGLNQEQKVERVTVINDLTKTNKLLETLSNQIHDYESTIKSLKDESVGYKNKINYIEGENIENQRKNMDNELKKTISIKIKRLDMFPNHFFGIAEIDKEEYKINIQGQSIFREKLIKLPIKFTDEKALLHLTGVNNAFFEDIVNYKGESEWIEIDSDGILYYLADHQDQINTIDILSRF